MFFTENIIDYYLNSEQEECVSTLKRKKKAHVKYGSYMISVCLESTKVGNIPQATGGSGKIYLQKDKHLLR